MDRLVPIAAVFVCSMLGAVAQLLFKLGVNPINIYKISLGLVLYGFAMILFLIVLRYGYLSVLYSIIAFSYLWVMLLSWKFLGEPIGLKQWVGAIGIIISVGLIIQ